NSPDLGGLALKLVAVTFPKDTQINEVGRVLREARFVDGREVERRSVGPEFLEPSFDAASHLRLIMAEVQLQVAGQTGGCEVGRPGDDAIPVREEVGFAVKEPLLIPPNLDATGL